jgi:hypothetical protein
LANWYGKSRSNYFAVKDEGAFNALMALYEVEVIGNADGLLGFISKTEFGTIPTREHEDSGEDPICILDELVEHLAEGHICVVMEVGSEKNCYVSGNAIAVSSTGETVEISLDDIYTAARAKFGNDAKVEMAQY